MSTNTPEALKKYVAYYLNDFHEKFSAFLSDDPKLIEQIDCEVYLAEDVEIELRRLNAENERLRQLIAYQGMDDTAAQLLATNTPGNSKQ